MNTTVRDPPSTTSNGRQVAASRVPEQATIAAKNIMTRSVITADLHTPVREIARLMSEHRFSTVPIISDRKVVGIVTAGDLLRREELGTSPAYCVAEPIDPACVKSRGRCAHDVMTPHVITVGEEATLAEIAGVMEDKRIRHVPVVQDGRLVGIVSCADLVRTLVSRPDGSHGPLLCDDDLVRFKVIEALMAIPGASAWLTEVTVANGVVGLSGVVEDENVREPSRRLIEKLPSVIRVDDRRTILQPYWG